MPQGSAEKSPLSVHRAFVVHFSTATDIGQGQIVGRVEHVVSYQTAHFHSLNELLSFIARVLTQGHKRAHN